MLYTKNSYNSGISTALIQGSLDGRALPINAQRTLEQIQTPPNALITLEGVNHFGITNVNTPDGSIPDPNTQIISQADSIETVARWSGLFLKGTILEDSEALEYVFDSGASSDPIVISVKGQSGRQVAKPVPEPLSLAGLLSGLICLIYTRKRPAVQEN
ncbi:MAG: PEP-CTERM sorting domain-containing protein [Cyanobacteria bacterium J06554_11]